MKRILFLLAAIVASLTSVASAGAASTPLLIGSNAPIQLGMFSPSGAAAAERAAAPMGLRYVYVTGGVGDGNVHAPRSDGGRGLHAFLQESARTRMLPILTYYQIQPSGPAWLGELDRARYVLRDRDIMRNYWRDLRDTLEVAGINRSQTVVLQVEPDGWEYIEQLGGVHAHIAVSSTGLRALHGLPNNARGFAKAFVRLRNRYAPNVLLGWHLSGWGVGQAGPPSVRQSHHLGVVGARFYRRLHAHFDIAFTDGGGGPFTRPGFRQLLALVSAFHHKTHLWMMLWQIRSTNIDWLLGRGKRPRHRLAAARRAGVRGLLWDTGALSSAGQSELLRAARHYYVHAA